jgi:hypothetical protein
MQTLTLPSAHSRLDTAGRMTSARGRTDNDPHSGEQPLASTAAAHYWTPCLAVHVHRSTAGQRHLRRAPLGGGDEPERV